MSIRKRSWEGKGKTGEAWVVDFTDASGKRRLKTFKTKREADRFHGVVKAIGSGQVPEPLASGYRPIEFSLPLPPMWKKSQLARETIAAALRAAYPALNPTTEAVIVHVIAEMPPSPVVADVDNLLKPVLDALKGVAWVDDMQVYEVMCRRLPARKQLLLVKIWQIPGPVFGVHLNALAALGDPSTAKRPSVTLGNDDVSSQA
jgi:Holliday junction resolvase RusA-like endonuclease